VRAALWTEFAVAAQLPKIQEECGIALEAQALYRVDITDANLDATLWIDPASNQAICAIRRGTAPTPGPIEPVDEATACKQQGGTWYDGRTSCLPCDAPPGGACAAVCSSGCRFTVPPSTLCKTGVHEYPVYQDSPAVEQEFTGTILLSTCPAGPTTLQRCPTYSLVTATDAFSIGAPGDEDLEPFLEQEITVRGKLVTFQLEGQELTELQIAALPCIRVTSSAKTACEKNGGTWVTPYCPPCTTGNNCLPCQPAYCEYPSPDPKTACEKQDGLWYDGKERCLPCEGNVCVTFCQPGCVEHPTDKQRCEYGGGTWNGQACAVFATPVPSAQLFLEYAAELGLDKAAFSACIDARTFQKEVLADQTAGTKAGVSGTPTFFVNGQQLVGAMPFESYQTAIDAELKSPTTRSVSVDDDPTLGSA
ncbi:MAG TPA: thioredoxin domain-containing protein, partial [archaeon]|nr:thioredoxin domain-containing protein [archaeon]